MQVNSDSRATEEYMDFLLGREKNPVTEDQPSVIVGGGGRVGSMLRNFGERRGFDDVIIQRGELIPADHPGPVYICTQTEDLSAVIAACPDEKKDDLVFLQEGMLEPLFQRYHVDLYLAAHLHNYEPRFCRYLYRSWSFTCSVASHLPGFAS